MLSWQPYRVVGTPFYLMDYVPGRVMQDPSLPSLQPLERKVAIKEIFRFILQFFSLVLHHFSLPFGGAMFLQAVYDSQCEHRCSTAYRLWQTRLVVSPWNAFCESSWITEPYLCFHSTLSVCVRSTNKIPKFFLFQNCHNLCTKSLFAYEKSPAGM